MHARVRAAFAVVLLVGLAACGPSTPPPPAPPDAGIIAFGDAGTCDAVQRGVANQMKTWSSSHRVDALVEAGDDVYPDGDPSLFPCALDTPYASLRTTRPLWVALGNHDVQNGNGPNQLRYLGLPDLPYAKSLKNVQILFLDANHPDAAQALWLEDQLSAPGPKLRIVVFHQPAYGCSEHGNTPEVDQYWVPILERHKVALVINGHEHMYERFLSASGVTYLVTGGGGAQIYPRYFPCSGVPPSQKWAVVNHFVGIEITGNTLKLTSVSINGSVIDRGTITR